MRRHLSTAVELCGAVALTYGMLLALGPAAGLITGGVFAILFGIGMDMPRRRIR